MSSHCKTNRDLIWLHFLERFFTPNSYHWVVRPDLDSWYLAWYICATWNTGIQLIRNVINSVYLPAKELWTRPEVVMVTTPSKNKIIAECASLRWAVSNCINVDKFGDDFDLLTSLWESCILYGKSSQGTKDGESISKQMNVFHLNIRLF